MSLGAIIFGAFMLASFFFRNSAKTMIKDIPTNFELYHRHYKTPSRFLRKMFGLKKQSIPKFLCFRLYVSFAFGVFAFIAAIILNVLDNNMVFKTMGLLMAGFVIVDSIQFIILSTVFKKYKK